jgi:ribosome-associated protein
VASIPQLKALRRDVDKDIKSIYSVSPRAIEGSPESLWLIIDYVDVIFHIFHDDLRTTYSLEDLWSDASKLELAFLDAE